MSRIEMPLPSQFESITPKESPYHRYGVCRNPFGELNRMERAENAIIDMQPWIESMRDRQLVVQIIGECGNGKSTHLLAIHRAIPSSLYVYLPESGPLPKIPEHRPLLVDEAQRLRRKELNQMLRFGGQLLLGTHVDLSQAVHKVGLSSQTFEVASKTDANHILRILNQRIAACSVQEPVVQLLTLEHAHCLFHRFGTNIRAIEHYLYGEFQRTVQQRLRWPPEADQWNDRKATSSGL